MVRSGIFMLRFVCVAVTAAVLVSCATPKTQYPSVDPGMLAREQQHQLKLANEQKAKQLARETRSRMQHLEQLNRVSTPIMHAGTRMCSRLYPQKANCVFTFELTDKIKGINAYADGKKVIITPEMMDYVQSDTQLAVILGHEYAHNMMRHVQSSQQNVAIGGILGALVDAAVKSQGYDSQGIFGQLGANAANLRYSSDFEREADYVGLYIMADAGFDIKNAPDIWRLLSLENQKSIYVESTHPTTSERFLSLHETIKEIHDKQAKNMPLIPNFKSASR